MPSISFLFYPSILYFSVSPPLLFFFFNTLEQFNTSQMSFKLSSLFYAFSLFVL